MYSSAYCGMDQLSIDVPALDFVSSVGLQAYDKRKGQRACSFISRLMEQFSFWAQKSITIASGPYVLKERFPTF